MSNQKKQTYIDALLHGLQNKHGKYEIQFNKKTQREEQIFVPASIDDLKRLAEAKAGATLTDVSEEELVLILTGKGNKVAFEMEEE